MGFERMFVTIGGDPTYDAIQRDTNYIPEKERRLWAINQMEDTLGIILIFIVGFASFFLAGKESKLYPKVLWYFTICSFGFLFLVRFIIFLVELIHYDHLAPWFTVLMFILSEFSLIIFPFPYFCYYKVSKMSN